jgi:hypothetical protein
MTEREHFEAWKATIGPETTSIQAIDDCMWLMAWAAWQASAARQPAQPENDEYERGYAHGLQEASKPEPAQEPDPRLIESMCMRYRHDWGLLDDERLKEVTRTTMRQLWEEVVGLGFYKAAPPAVQQAEPVAWIEYGPEGKVSTPETILRGFGVSTIWHTTRPAKIGAGNGLLMVCAAPPAQQAEPVALEHLCGVLPAETYWGDPITPDVVRHILSVGPPYAAPPAVQQEPEPPDDGTRPEPPPQQAEPDKMTDPVGRARYWKLRALAAEGQVKGAATLAKAKC